jgi:hypothetical protein
MTTGMDELQIALLLRLLIAHLVADFVLQRKSWIVARHALHWRTGSLYLHAAIAGILVYLFSGRYHEFLIPAFVVITHLATDLWKSYTNGSLRYFLADQFIHLLVIVAAWYMYIMPDWSILESVMGYFANTRVLAIVLAYIFVIWPAGFLIAKITAPWQNQITNNQGLADAGRWIGMIERILILTFVLIHQFTGIGFLIAAKSILRFGDIRNPENRKDAEYILLGTMISFIIAIFTGIAVQNLFA